MVHISLWNLLLVYADINILGGSVRTKKKPHTEALVVATKEI